MPARALSIGGFEPFSATEYPGKLSAIVFVQGCPWRCGYCHNPQLQQRMAVGPLSWERLLPGLAQRAGLLDAVVFCGGEPTIDPALEPAMREVRALGFQVGLETAGIYPERLREVLPLVDWVGLDIKAPFDRYADVTGVRGSGEPARASLKALLESGVDFECRTTVHPAQLPPTLLRELAQSLSELGVRHYALQEFRPTGCNDIALSNHRQPGYPDAALVTELEPLFERLTVRRSQ